MQQLATKLVSTRKGTLIAALLIALLAGASILLYLNSYRDSLKAQGALVTVLVAKQTIPKGTSGERRRVQGSLHGHDDPREPAARGRDERPRHAARQGCNPRDLRGGAS